MQIKTNQPDFELKPENLKKIKVTSIDNKKLEKSLLWRYMSFPKFLDLMLNQRLYFSDLITLAKEDPRESAFPMYADYPVYIQKLVNNYKKSLPHDIESDEPIRITFPNYDEIEKIANDFNKIRQTTYVNCWHINKDESYAMWKIYACNDASVAIVTDIEKLKDSIISDKEINAAIVKYDDKKFFSSFQKMTMETLKNRKELKKYIRKASFYKRDCFNYENEFRLVFQDDNLLNYQRNYVQVDINKLIKYIYVSPTTEEYVKNVIKSTLTELNNEKKYELNLKEIIVESAINGNDLNDFMGSFSRFSIEQKKTRNENMSKDEVLAYMLLLLCSTNSLHRFLSV